VRGKKGGGAQILDKITSQNETGKVEETRTNRAFFQALNVNIEKKNGEYFRGCNVLYILKISRKRTDFSASYPTTPSYIKAMLSHL